jgi:hypothetical protein
LFFSIYNERAPLPDVTVQKVESDGQLGTEIIEERKASDGVLREIEIGVVMDMKVAKALVDWLQERIKIGQQIQSQIAIKESELKS